ncbi:MAG: carboxypeptidase regulatory-like domain-containing protein [Blastocatellia bacterium]|nr:carboxypeptidase regulatory-like domain-containing protein [Blastocatellia bacterium]
MRNCLSLLLCLFCVSPSIFAQETKPASVKVEAKSSEAEPSNLYGAITGRVISEDGPLPFVSITVLPVSNNTRGRGGNAPRNVTTDAEGNFKVDGLRASAWNVIPSAQGYVVETTNDETTQQFYRINESATIRMSKGGVITGRVLSAAGEPLIAVPVSVQYIRDAQGRPASGGTNTGFFQTDDRGVYRIYGLQPGNYVVSAGRTGGGGPGGGGRSPYDGDVPTYFPSATRDTAVEVSVSSGGETSGIDIQYRGGKGRAVSGKITGAVTDTTNTNRPAFGPGGGGPGGGGISVTLTHAATGTVFNRTFVMSRSGTPTYALYGVPDGEYEVTAERDTPGGNDAVSVPRRVVVTGRDVTGIDLTLMPMASVAAKLQLEVATTKCETNHKATFEEQLFVLQPEEEKNTATRPNLRRAFLDNSLVSPERTGEMSFRNLNIGRYYLVAKLLDDNWYIRSITLPGAPFKTAAKAGAKATTTATTTDVARTGLNLKSGDKITGLMVKVSEGAAALKGNVKADEPLPPLLRVYVVPAEKERTDEVLRYAVAAVATDGSFSVGHLAPGKYWLLTRSEFDDARKKIWDNTERTKLRREAEAANIAVELQACQRVTNYELRLKK